MVRQGEVLSCGIANFWFDLLDFLSMRFLILAVTLLFPADTWWAVRESGVDSNLRGVSIVVDESLGGDATIWATGSNGAVVRSSDSGKSWKRLAIPEGDSLDIRGVQAFDSGIAYVMASGEGAKSRIYKTTDGGKSWKQQYAGENKAFFLDALVCADEKRCFALSDPVDGKFLLIATEDGQSWKKLPGDHMPAALAKEGAFAASNSALCLEGKDIFFGTGGPAARVFHSSDVGRTWAVEETPVASGNASSGIFSLVCDGKTIVAVGGDYQNPAQSGKNAAFSRDGGKTWELAAIPPTGYRSGVATFRAGYVAVGPTGTEVSADGSHWKHVDGTQLNAITFSGGGGKGWAAGPHGSVARFMDQTQYSL